MTWRELLALLNNMSNVEHTSLDERVTFLFDNEEYYVDLVESLSSGTVVLTITFGPE